MTPEQQERARKIANEIDGPTLQGLARPFQKTIRQLYEESKRNQQAGVEQFNPTNGGKK
jgi:hypothetical protein